MKALIAITLTLASIGCFAQTQQAPTPGVHRKAKPKALPSPSPATSPALEDPSKDAGMSPTTIRMVAAALVFIPLYWIPTFVAFGRKHRNRGAIAVTNLLLGWTVLGWCAALIWACTNPAPLALAKGAGQ